MSVPKIFVIEDDDRLIKILKENFTAIFPSTIYVFDRRHNLTEEIATVGPDIILCNMQMKEEVTKGDLDERYFNKLGNFLDIPIIAISEEEKDADKAIEQGANDFFWLRDPYFINLLSWSLNVILNSQKMIQKSVTPGKVRWFEKTGTILLIVSILIIIYLLI